MNRPSGSVAAALLSAVVLLVVSGIGASTYQYLGDPVLALSTASLLLALILGMIILIRDRSNQRKFGEVAGIRGEIRRLRLDFDKFIRRIEVLEANADDADEEPPLAGEIEHLRQTLGRFAAEHGAAPAPKPSVPPVAVFDHALELYLEPIVGLESGRTIHYRAAIALAAPDGRQVSHEELARRLNNQALRASLDVHCLSRILPLTRKLVLRRQNTLIFVPVGGETLASADAMRQLVTLLESDEGFAPSIAFEIDHRAMAGLSAQGVEGLAALARQGAAMALTNVASQAVDLTALRALRFSFLSFPVQSMPRTALGKPDWSGLATFASEQGFAVEVRGIDSGEQANRAKKWAKLGSGPAFAPPRRVRGDGGTASSISAAA